MSATTAPPSGHPDSSPSRGSAGALPGVRSSVSVMVVDDDADIREILTEILVRASYSVVAAGDGAEALGLLETVRPSLILLDLNMPVMDGFEFRRRQRLDLALREIPTVVMSALYQMRERIVALDVDHALAKPVDLQEFLGVVKRYCVTTPAA